MTDPLTGYSTTMWLLALLACETAPSITLISPSEGAVVCGAPLEVEVAVDAFTLVEVGDDTPVDGASGHVDVYLNGQSVNMASETTLRLADVADGEYQLRVELVNADHSALSPPASDLVYVTVSAEACP